MSNNRKLLLKAIEKTEYKISKWTALAASCQGGSCGSEYANQKLDIYYIILKALKEKREREKQ